MSAPVNPPIMKPEIRKAIQDWLVNDMGQAARNDGGFLDHIIADGYVGVNNLSDEDLKREYEDASADTIEAFEQDWLRQA